LIFLLLLPLCAYGANDLRVLLVLSESMSPYQTFAKTFQQNLSPNFQVSVLERPENFSVNENQADLIVTVGIKATDWMIGKTTTPVFAVMIPSTKYFDLLEKQTRGRQISAIYIDQPWSRQVALLHAALPESRSIGVLYSSETRLNLRTLQNELARHGYKLVAKQMQSKETLSSDLEEVLARSDVLLAIPDSNIFSSSNIRNILLSSYRQRIPLVGLSQAYVNAGALCAIFSTPEQLAVQASVTTKLFAQTRHLPDPQPPALYTIAVNQDVARTLGVTTKSADLLHMQVEEERGVP
jgi:putative ABC transport system substrate-binding protein